MVFEMFSLRWAVYSQDVAVLYTPGNRSHKKTIYTTNKKNDIFSEFQ